MSDSNGARLARFMQQHRRLTVLTGAGCSTNSGIPDYRDDDGNWRNAKPVQYADFVNSPATRKRYWARSFAGWHRISCARPNGAHESLAKFEKLGFVDLLVTQNVDNLHRRAGSRQLVDLHGVLSHVRCLQCDSTCRRDDFQSTLEQLNPGWVTSISAIGPDGDAFLRQTDFNAFAVPDCRECGGLVKPDVVFFGEAVPAEKISRAKQSLELSDALLIVGSSLMVFSGFRFARLAKAAGKPIAIVNRGRTRADDLAAIKLQGDSSAVLFDALRLLQHS